MSDSFQSIVVRGNDDEDVESIRKRVLDFLMREAIIGGECIDCVLSEERGFSPGPNASAATSSSSKSFEKLEVNGFALVRGKGVKGRGVFDAGSHEPAVHCPSCDATLEDAAAW